MGIADLILRFLYVGLFTVGGGLASVPLLLQAVVEPGYISHTLFYNMVAISESTPGPIGVNLATYIGYGLHGIGGGVIATLSIAAPCFFISYFTARAFGRIEGSPVIKAALYGVRAAVAGLIAVAAYGVLSITVFTWGRAITTAGPVDLKALAVFAALLFFVMRFKKHPVITVLIGAAAGVVLF
ncbi:MAG: chromate transporter [Oscillospiraceae bacterium]|nr:chromate transporter [Oscillospiraceae bacterium]